MKTSARSLINLGLVMLPIGGVFFFALRQQAVARLRVDQDALRMEKSEVDRLTLENQQLDRLRTDLKDVEQLREANRDLPRLRSEITQLRQQAKELESQRAEQERLLAQARSITTASAQTAPANLPASFLAKSALRDSGLATPEATVQTAFSAILQNNGRRLLQCLVPRGPNSSPQYRFMGNWSEFQHPETIPAGLKDQISHFQGFAIAERKIISPTETIIGLQSSEGGTVLPLKLVLIGHEWRLEDN